MDLGEIARAQAKANGQRRPPREKLLRPTTPAAADVARFSRQIRALQAKVRASVEAALFPILQRFKADGALDSVRAFDDIADELAAAFGRVRLDMDRLTMRHSALIASEMVRRSDARHRARFFQAVEEAIGINLQSVVEEEGLSRVLKLKTHENVGLISSIPEEYLGKVERLVWGQVVQGRSDGRSMISALRQIGGVSDRRARFIARDQTAKLVSALNRERNTALGLEEYVWRISRDEKVRKSHREKEGRRYRYDDPPADTGHPGDDFQCRCTGAPILKL